MIEINQIYYFIDVLSKKQYIFWKHIFMNFLIFYISRYISSSAEKINRSMD